MDSRPPDQLQQVYPPIVKRGFGYSRVEQIENGFRVFAEKGRLSRLGVYIVHLSIIFLLIGGLIGSFFGFEGFVNIPEGETVRSIRIRNSNNVKPLDFAVRCDDFSVTYYDSGSPREYRSSLTILENGIPLFQKDIIVNDPLHYKGVNFFQSSYGKLPPNYAVVSVTSKESGKSYELKAIIGQPFDLPEDMGKFELKGYDDSMTFRGHRVGEAFVGEFVPKDREPMAITIPLRFPNFDKMRKGQQVFSIKGYDERYYTGLQVTKDPGVWVVYLGFVLMIIGCFMTFYLSHQRVCVEVVKSGQKSKVMLAGLAEKNRLGMQKKISRILKDLNESGQKNRVM